MDTSQLMSVREAAKELGCSRARVYELARSGVLASERVGEKIMVNRAGVASRRALQERRRICFTIPTLPTRSRN